jgi:hypothetical protein
MGVCNKSKIVIGKGLAMYLPCANCGKIHLDKKITSNSGDRIMATHNNASDDFREEQRQARKEILGAIQNLAETAPPKDDEEMRMMFAAYTLAVSACREYMKAEEVLEEKWSKVQEEKGRKLYK